MLISLISTIATATNWMYSYSKLTVTSISKEIELKITIRLCLLPPTFEVILRNRLI
jgi:hypothetical protein